MAPEDTSTAWVYPSWRVDGAGQRVNRGGRHTPLGVSVSGEEPILITARRADRMVSRLVTGLVEMGVLVLTACLLPGCVLRSRSKVCPLYP